MPKGVYQRKLKRFCHKGHDRLAWETFSYYSSDGYLICGICARERAKLNGAKKRSLMKGDLK